MLLTHNLVDVNPDQPPVEKLQELEERIEAWSTLVPRKTDFEYVVNGPTSIYELQEGIFLHTEGDIDWVEQLRGVKVSLIVWLVPLLWLISLSAAFAQISAIAVGRQRVGETSAHRDTGCRIRHCGFDVRSDAGSDRHIRKIVSVFNWET